jgi:hypothetical protein
MAPTLIGHAEAVRGVWLSVPIIIPPGNVVLEHDFLDDPRAWLPEPDAIASETVRRKS